MGTERIADFWQWWTGVGRAAVTDAVQRADIATVDDLLARRSRDIDLSLSFDVRRGTSSAYRLSLSSGGPARGRVIAERWWCAAPPADETWQFAPARPRDRKVLEREHRFSRYRVLAGEVAIAWTFDEVERRYDVRLVHPQFPVVPPSPKSLIVDAILGGLLGEDERARWIGSRAGIASAEDARPLPEFAALVEEQDAARVPAEQWKNVTGEGVRGRILVNPHWLDEPLLDQLCRMIVPSGAVELAAELGAVLGPRCRVVATAAIEGHEAVFAYVDSSDAELVGWLEQWAATRGCIGFASVRDPGWGAARGLRLPQPGDGGEFDLVDDLSGGGVDDTAAGE